MPGYSKGMPLHCHLLLIAVYRIAGARYKECLHVLVYYKGGGQLNHHTKEICSVNANQ